MRLFATLAAVVLAAASAFAQTRQLGPVFVSELSFRDGKISFRADSNGCTDAGSFQVDVRKDEGASPRVPHYRLTIRRVRVDDCKALVWDGVVIEMDLEQDLGLAGGCTLSIENPIFPRYRRTE